ncbi:MAG: MBL fold metallo-hydrolase [Clostridia bacterium]|nr:MBL fold metallo-hydrolase [Clostridia bacterium]
MRKIWLVLACMMMVCTAAVSRAEDTWMFVTNVGKGDAVFCGVGDSVCLIDTGYPYARGRILAAMEALDIDHLDAVFVTHTDKDHVGGLDWLAQSAIPVDTWYASAMYMDYKEKKHPAYLAAKSRGQSIVWLKAGDQVTLGCLSLSVLGPMQMAEDKDDNNSLVMMLESEDGRILLCGDMETPEEDTILDTGVSLTADVLKVGNHGDGDATGKAFAEAVRPRLSVVSTSAAEKPGTPSEKVVRRLSKLGSEVVSTEDTGLGVYVHLLSGRITCEGWDVPETADTVRILSVDPDTDTVVLKNDGTAPAELTNWYLYSSRGEEMFIFPEETDRAAGATLTVGTQSTGKATDLVWQEKSVIHAKKSDTISLYDRYGTLRDAASNGL